MLPYHPEKMLSVAQFLRKSAYRFTTISPHSHSIYLNKHGDKVIANLRDIFGWNLKFDPTEIDSSLLAYLKDGGLVRAEGGLLRSLVRCSTAGSEFFFHSSYPTEQTDSVFFGPDTYRFLDFLGARATGDLGRLIDVGCGSGAGAIRCSAQASSVTFSDINPLALEFAKVNACLNAVDKAAPPMEFKLSDFFSQLEGKFDTVISNPPFVIDNLGRTYRHGGKFYGTELSQEIAKESYARLNKGGRLFLYTGAPQIEGVDVFKEAMQEFFKNKECNFFYNEMDPDIFGDELAGPLYSDVERLAAVTLVVTRT